MNEELFSCPCAYVLKSYCRAGFSTDLDAKAQRRRGGAFVFVASDHMKRGVSFSEKGQSTTYIIISFFKKRYSSFHIALRAKRRLSIVDPKSWTVFSSVLCAFLTYITKDWRSLWKKSTKSVMPN